MNSYWIKIEGKRAFRFLKTLIELQIPFEKKKEGISFIIIEVSEEDYERIEKIKSTYNITIIKRTGILYFLHLLKTKKAFICAVIFGFFTLIFLSRMTFSIQIIETDSDIKKMILEDLEQFGIKKYHFKVNYEEKKKIRSKILEKEQDYLEWLEIEEVGTSYQIKLIKRLKEEEQEIQEDRHIIAKKKGIVTRIEAEKGEVVVQKNQTVEEGEVLISGLIKNKETIVSKVPATGHVFAEVWYQVNMKLPKFYQEEEKTGRKKEVLNLSFLNKDILTTEIFPYEHKKEKRQVLWYHPLLPLAIEWIKEEEVKIKNTNYTTDTITQEIIPLAIKKLKDKLGNDIVILSEKVLKKKESADKIEIEIFFKVEEEITAYQSLKDFDIEKENQKEEMKE